MFYCLLNGVCLLVYVLFLYVQCATLLKVECVVEDPNLFEDDPHETFEQGKWIIPLHILFVPNQCI
jgi:hypothetical protein